MCNSLVWDDLRTSNVVRHFEQKLDEEGIEIDEEDAEPEQTVDSLGTGKAEAAFAEKGKVVNDAAGVVGTVGKLMEGLGLAGRGKEGGSNRRRKGKEGLLDM